MTQVDPLQIDLMRSFAQEFPLRRVVIRRFPIYPIYRFTNFGLNKSADLLINRPIYHRFITDLSPIYYRFITDLPNKSADLFAKSADLSPIYQ